MTDDELKAGNPELYRVAREKGTEPAFTGKYVNTKENGMYHCAVCGATLFSSETKFDSGSGWPSFVDPVFKDAVTLHDDTSYGMSRTEVRCAKCDAHLGHVFPDGPKREGRVCDRYCINSVSLDLKKEPDKTSTAGIDSGGVAGGAGSSPASKGGTQEKGFFERLAGGDFLSEGGDDDGGGD